MKKIITIFSIIIASMLLSSNANAQFSIDFGYVMEQINSKFKDGGDYVKEDPLLLNGIYFGISYNWDLVEEDWGNISFNPGVDYTFASGGAAADDLLGVGDRIYGQIKLNDHLINVPLKLRYSYEFVDDTFTAFLFGGPVLSFGLNSELEGTIKYLGSSTSLSLNLLSGNTVLVTPTGTKIHNKVDDGKLFNFFDLKMSAGLGCIICEDYEIRASYDFGLLNRSLVQNQPSGKHNVIKVNYLRVGLSYLF